MAEWHPIRNREGEVSKYAIRSACGRWRVCRVTVCGVDRFELWDGRELKASYMTAAEAKEAAR